MSNMKKALFGALAAIFAPSAAYADTIKITAGPRITDAMINDNHGVSPKEYGMYLQSTGRQKWTKKRSKK